MLLLMTVVIGERWSYFYVNGRVSLCSTYIMNINEFG